MEQCTLTETGAYLTATTISAAYVASLYVLPKRIRQLPRDHPRHIYGRFAAVALSSVFAVALYARVADPRCLGVGGVAAALGLRLDGSTTAALKGAACVAVLYLGTLAERLVLGAFTLPEINPQAWRNLVVGPRDRGVVFSRLRAAFTNRGRHHEVAGRADGSPGFWPRARAPRPAARGRRRRAPQPRCHRNDGPVRLHVALRRLRVLFVLPDAPPERARRRSRPVQLPGAARVRVPATWPSVRPPPGVRRFAHVAGIALFFTRSGWLLSSESVLWA